MIGSFAYLIVRSTRNRLVSQMKRARSPRYAIALLLALGYFWLVFFRRTRGAPPIALPGDAMQSLFAVGLLVMTAWTWIVGADRAALAFTPAEVSLLFTAPVSRRDLIVYKLVRAQAPVLTTSLIWALVFRRGSPADSVERAIAFWGLLSTLSFHRLGVALIRASQAEHGVKGLRRSLIPMLVFGAAVVALIVGVLPLGDELADARSAGEMFRMIGAALLAPPLGWLMYPFRVAIAPVFAPAGLAWLRAIGAALVLLALHAWWVLRMDAAFEETAVEASAAHARRLEAMRARREVGGVATAASTKWSIRLAPTGPRPLALVWKNALWLVRTGQVRGLLAPPLIGLASALLLARRSEVAATLVAAFCAVIAAMLIVFGPLTVRSDLRNELLHLPLIKTLPLRGRQIVLAEVASSAPAVALMQLLLLAAAAIATSHLPTWPMPVSMMLATIATLPLFLLGLNMVNFAIHNGLAVLYPAWTRLGGAGAGIEAMGQMMLTTLATLLMLLLLLILPAVAVGIAGALLRTYPELAIAVGGTLAGVLLVAESWVMVGLLGEALERVEPAHVG